MQTLTKAQINPIRQLVTLRFSDNSYFPVSIDDYYQLHPTTIDASLITASFLFLLKDYALRQLSFSPKTSTILKLKLRQYYYQLLHRYRYPLKPSLEPLLNSVIDYLTSRSLLSSDSFIKHLINQNPLKSTRHLIFLFQKAGLSQSEYNPYLPDLYRADETKVRKLISKRPTLPYLKLFSWLVGRGFDQSTVKTIIDETNSNR